MVTIGGARGLHDRRSGRSVVGSRLLIYLVFKGVLKELVIKV